jgi:protein arginine N-methyltransferase 1
MTHSIQGYSLSDYGSMITDNRVEPYVQALKATVKPNSIVLDIGTGTGFFAVLACQFGAQKVYAIEPDDAIIVARQVARDNHCADRIEFIQAVSTEVQLSERVDVMVSDLRGVLPLFQNHIRTIADARERFLTPHGLQIPQQDTLWLTLISDPEGYAQKYQSPWLDHPYGCNLAANRRFVTSRWRKIRLQPAQFVVEPQVWTVLDYKTCQEPNVKNTLTWQMTEPCTVHGLGLWFDTVLVDNIGFSNAPGQPDYIYGQAFFPFSEPVDIVPGDRVTVTLQAHLVQTDYIWSWHTQVTAGDSPTQAKANFQQSTFWAEPLSPQMLRKQSDQYVPRLNETAHVDRFILQQMAEALPLGEIAQQLVQQFPQRFSHWQAALSYVGELSQKYSE